MIAFSKKQVTGARVMAAPSPAWGIATPTTRFARLVFFFVAFYIVLAFMDRNQQSQVTFSPFCFRHWQVEIVEAGQVAHEKMSATRPTFRPPNYLESV